MDLQIDRSRTELPETGIYVRAKDGDKWGAHDIVELTPESLLTWLRSRGGENSWAENTLAHLLGHKDPITNI